MNGFVRSARVGLPTVVALLIAMAFSAVPLPAQQQQKKTTAAESAAKAKAGNKANDKTKADDKAKSTGADTSAKPAKPQSADPIERAVDFLIAQSEAFDPKYDGPERLTFTRPNGPVGQLKVEDGPRIVDRMRKSLTGNDIRDSYVRWHLMHVVLKARPEDRKKIADDLMSVAKTLKAYIKPEFRPDHRDEPEEIGREYRRLVGSITITEGVPPFQKTVYPPDSLKSMTGARKAEAEKIWARAQKLREKFEVIRDDKAVHWNESMRRYNWMQRQYRGEIMYAMFTSGDPDLFDSAISATVGLAKTDVEQACDAVSFLNAAYFNGQLKQYDMRVLSNGANRLKQAAGQYSKWDNDRSLPEAVFHFVRAIEAERVPNPLPSNPLADYPKLPPAVKLNVTPEKLDLAMIDQAIARGTRALLTAPYPDVMINHYSLQFLGLPSYPYFLAAEGHQSLAAWAMLAAGESNQSPLMVKRINWSLSHDSPTTFSR